MELSDEGTEPPSCLDRVNASLEPNLGATACCLHAQGRRFYGYKLIDRQGFLAFATEVSSVALSAREATQCSRTPDLLHTHESTSIPRIAFCGLCREIEFCKERENGLSLAQPLLGYGRTVIRP